MRAIEEALELAIIATSSPSSKEQYNAAYEACVRALVLLRSMHGPDGYRSGYVQLSMANDLCDALNDAYAAGQEDRWISVDERLPELNLDVFFWANGTWHWGFRSTADFGEANHVWIAHGEDGDDCEVDEDEVTHWQPEFRAPSTPVTK